MRRIRIKSAIKAIQYDIVCNGIELHQVRSETIAPR
jgi:aspartyl-tRNA synthetase